MNKISMLLMVTILSCITIGLCCGAVFFPRFPSLNTAKPGVVPGPMKLPATQQNFIEMWAGVSKEFFTPAQFPANSTLQFDEFYAPTVGLTSFTHASEHAVINLTTNKDSYNGTTDDDVRVVCRYVVTKSADQVTLLLQFTGDGNAVTVYNDTRTHDANGTFEIKKTVALQDLCDEVDRLVFELQVGGTTQMQAEVAVAMSNAGTCSTSSKPEVRRQQRILADAGSQGSRKLFAINGVYLGEAREHYAFSTLRNGVVVSVDKKERCTRHIALEP